MKTVTLETARRLREAGYSQEESFWVFDEDDGIYQRADWQHDPGHDAAPTAGELLEWMRERGAHFPAITWADDHWSADYLPYPESGSVYDEEAHPDNPAEALGLLAIRMLEES